MKKCPYCAEEIQIEAIKCKHCGRALDVSHNKPNKIGEWLIFLSFFTIPIIVLFILYYFFGFWTAIISPIIGILLIGVGFVVFFYILSSVLSEVWSKSEGEF